jgi:hypothetical protein
MQSLNAELLFELGRFNNSLIVSKSDLTLQLQTEVQYGHNFG